MVTRIESRLKKLESSCLGQDDKPDGVLIVPQDEVGRKKAIKNFYKKYPDYSGTLIILPEVDREDG